MHGVRVAGDQRMPPIEIAALVDQAIAAGGGQPVDLIDIVGRQRHAFLARAPGAGHRPCSGRSGDRAAGRRHWSSRSRRCLHIRACIRQHLPQPSQSDSHSAGDISAIDFVFQKGSSSMKWSRVSRLHSSSLREGRRRVAVYVQFTTFRNGRFVRQAVELTVSVRPAA